VVVGRRLDPLDMRCLAVAAVFEQRVDWEPALHVLLFCPVEAAILVEVLPGLQSKVLSPLLDPHVWHLFQLFHVVSFRPFEL